MTCKFTLIGCAAVFGALLVLVGCQPAAQDPPVKGGDPSASAQSDDDEAAIAAELAKLPAKDRALAEKQKTCPVTGERLGAMGAPYKLVVKGQTVFLCCPGCKDKILKDPDKYLEKLKKGPAKK
jgi:YHS domain-containing protein